MSWGLAPPFWEASRIGISGESLRREFCVQCREILKYSEYLMESDGDSWVNKVIRGGAAER